MCLKPFNNIQGNLFIEMKCGTKTENSAQFKV